MRDGSFRCWWATLAAWNYFQSIDTPENKKFVQKSVSKTTVRSEKIAPGGADRVTDDPIEAAYFGVYVWKVQRAKARRASMSTRSVNKFTALNSTHLAARKRWIPKNQHTWKPVFIGEIKKDGQFKIINSSEGSGSTRVV